MIRGVGIHHANLVWSRLGSCEQYTVQVSAMFSEPKEQERIIQRITRAVM